jgi:hypothetical protein
MEGGAIVRPGGHLYEEVLQTSWAFSASSLFCRSAQTEFVLLDVDHYGFIEYSFLIPLLLLSGKSSLHFEMRLAADDRFYVADAVPNLTCFLGCALLFGVIDSLGPDVPVKIPQDWPG